MPGLFHRRRRCFDHLVAEISTASGRRIPRYELWLHLHELGLDPDRLDREAALAFCGRPLLAFLAARGVRLAPGAQRTLRRGVGRFDARHPSPEEWLTRTLSS